VFGLGFQMKIQLPLDPKVHVAFGAVMAVLLVVGIVAYRSVIASSDSARWAQHTNEVLEHLANLRLDVDGVESGFRDFALSGADAFLQRSRASTSLADEEQSVLLALTADNPSQQHRLSIITELRQRMAQRGGTLMGLRGSSAAEEAAARFRSGQDDSLLDAFRVAASDMEREEHRLLRERNAAAVSRNRETQVVLIVGSTLALLIAALSGWRVARDRAERKKAENRLKSLNRLYAMATGISASMVRVRDRTDLFNRACRTAVEQGEFDMAWIAIVDPNQNRFIPVSWAGHDEPAMSITKTHFSSNEGTLQGNTLAARAIAEKAAVISNDVEADDSLIFGKMHAQSGVRSLAVLPLIVSDNPIGVFALYTSKPEFFDAAGLQLLTELAGNVAFAVDHLERQERLDRLANYDALTGLANRRSFLERVTQHMLNAANEGHKMAVFMIDLERFKKLNDSLGRTAGDTLLKQMAEWLAQNAENADLVARLDADHFAVVLPKVMYESNVARVLEKTIAAFMKQWPPLKCGDSVAKLSGNACPIESELMQWRHPWPPSSSWSRSPVLF